MLWASIGSHVVGLGGNFLVLLGKWKVGLAASLYAVFNSTNTFPGKLEMLNTPVLAAVLAPVLAK